MTGDYFLDPTPLVALAHGRTLRDRDGERPTDLAVAELLGTSAQQLRRWRRGQRLHVDTADRLCTRLGLHMVHVWGLAVYNDAVSISTVYEWEDDDEWEDDQWAA